MRVTSENLNEAPKAFVYSDSLTQRQRGAPAGLSPIMTPIEQNSFLISPRGHGPAGGAEGRPVFLEVVFP